MTQKFGSAPLFLDYIKFYNKPEYRQAVRAQYAVLGQVDITPINTALAWYMKVRLDFGVAEPDATFHGFFAQKEITSGNKEVPVSYYRSGGKVLVQVSNFGNDAFSGTLNVDLAALGLKPGQVRATQFEDGGSKSQDTLLLETDIPVQAGGATIPVDVPRHDFRLIQLAPKS
jgi:hypothetical protein